MTDLRQAAQQVPKTNPCDTCNASHKNTLPRIVRCGTCVVRPGQMPTKWRQK